MYMSCQRDATILFLSTYYMIQYIVGRKLQHPYSKRQSGDFQKFTFDPSKIHNTHSTTIHVYVMSTPCSNFIPVNLLYDTTQTGENYTPLLLHYLRPTKSSNFQQFTFNPTEIHNTHHNDVPPTNLPLRNN